MDPGKWVLWGLLLVLAVVLGNVVWVLAVRRLYRPRTAPPQLLRTRCADGWELAVHARQGPDAALRGTCPAVPWTGGQSVHLRLRSAVLGGPLPGRGGLRLLQRGVARHRALAAARLAGRRYTDFTVDDHILQDGPALLELALKETGAKRAFWLGHSLGALVGYARGPGSPGTPARRACSRWARPCTSSPSRCCARCWAWACARRGPCASGRSG